jgi:hypothetical protein
VKLARLTATEPGSPRARLHGCTCPQQTPTERPDGSATYQRDERCPVHRHPHSFTSDRAFRHARSIEDTLEHRRAA